MLYKIAHILRDKLPWIWDIIGIINSFLFGLRYGSKMKNVQNILSHFTKTTDEAGNALSYRIESLGKDNFPMLAKMFAEQPASAFDFFKPHGFDDKSLSKLIRDKSFLAYIVTVNNDDNQPVCVGYFFQRSFFWGKSFRGYMTDFRWRRKGINKLMNQCATEISSFLGLHVYGTIAPENIASMKSAQAANDVKIIETLRNGDYLVEYLPKS